MEMEAYVINTKELSKSDVIITIISPFGINVIFGRGYLNIKHKFHVLVNRGIKVRLFGEFKGDYFRLSDFDLISSENILTLDIDRFEKYVQIVKLVKYLDKRINATGFALFDFCISELETYPMQLLIDLWKVYVLKLENIFLEFTKCVNCDQQYSNYITLSLTDGGLICRNCFQGQQLISQEDIRTINAFYQSKLSFLKRGYSPIVSQILSELVDGYVGLKIN